MKLLNKIALLFFISFFYTSCTNKHKSLNGDQIAKFIEDKQICYLNLRASGNLTYDYPNSIIMAYVKNNAKYTQVLNVEELKEPKKSYPLNENLYYATGANNLINFEVNKVLKNATNFIKKESNYGFEGFTILNITITPTQNWKKEKNIKREITIQAIKKTKELKHKFSKSKMPSSKNLYEFKFYILENSEVIFNK